MALSYLLARGVGVDLTRYAHWRRIALERGERYMQLLEAQDRLAKGDQKRADQLLQSSAAKNVADAQFQLGELFLEGKEGWPQDDTQGHMWMTIAAASGCLEAPAILKRIAKTMRAAQLEQSASLAALWGEAHPTEPGRRHPIKGTACKVARTFNG